MHFPTLRTLTLAVALATASTGTRVIGAIADINVVDRQTGQVLPVYTHQGRHYVAGRPDNAGVIGVAVFRERPVPVQMPAPACAPRPYGGLGASSRDDAVGSSGNAAKDQRAERAGPAAPVSARTCNHPRWWNLYSPSNHFGGRHDSDSVHDGGSVCRAALRA